MDELSTLREEDDTLTESAYLQAAIDSLIPEPPTFTLNATDDTEATATGEQKEDDDTYFDGKIVIKAPVATADVTAKDERDLFVNESGIGFALGFRQGRGLSISFVYLKQIIEDKEYSGNRFECMRTVSRLSQICLILSTLLQNQEGQGTIDLDDLAPIVSSSFPALKLLGVELIIHKTLRNIL